MTFRPNQMHLLGLAFMTTIAFMVMLNKPLVLWPFEGLFLVAMLYVRRAKTVVDEKGIRIKNAAPTVTEIPWENVKGVYFKHGQAQLRTTDDKKLRMPGVSFNSLPELAKASQGRIPDPGTQGNRAARDTKDQGQES